MPFLFFAAIALIGGAIHVHRDSQPRSTARTLEILLGVLCARFRDGFLLAAVIAVSICYLGDAYGHLHQAALHDNHDPDNTGLVLWADFITPLVAIGLYVASRRSAAARTRPSA